MHKNDDPCETVNRSDVTVEVTPMLQQGNTIVCEIDAGPGSGGKVKGGVVKLKGGDSYRLIFELKAGAFPSLEFSQGQDGAFWCDMTSCPSSAGNSSNGQLFNATVKPNDPKRLIVDADPKPPKNAIFYSLNFNNGCSYDPVIIHE